MINPMHTLLLRRVLGYDIYQCQYVWIVTSSHCKKKKKIIGHSETGLFWLDP